MDGIAKLLELGVQVPDILIPQNAIDYFKWSVVACDQFTSEPEYWEGVEKLVGNEPSTLRLIYPEVYLQEPDKQKRIQNINTSMDQYLREGLFTEIEQSFIYVQRVLSSGRTRKGLLLALDLEKYSYEKGANSLIRATEGTILDRLPPRIEIRKNAPIELPHIMVLIDDKENSLFSHLDAKRKTCEKLYATELMEDGGSVSGFRVTGPEMLEELADIFTALYEAAKDREKNAPLLFAMGDGNHSFATAKAIWEETKKKTGNINHPARWALVEIVNIYDYGLLFEPIHRLAFGLKMDTVQNAVSGSAAIDLTETGSINEALDKVSGGKEHSIALASKGFTGLLTFKAPQLNLAVASLDTWLEEHVPDSGEIDYIHGAKTAADLAVRKNGVAFILPDFQKEQLFPTVMQDGALPRKTFSMGEAEEKRYYLEGRKIIT